MTEDQKKKIQKRIAGLTYACVALLGVLLIVLAVTKRLNTILFPVGSGVILAVYWVISDVLSVVWLHSFDGKTDSQKRSYYFYALADAAGLAGLIYFVVRMTNMNGALVFAASIFLKRRFYDEYLGVKQESEEEPEAAAVKEEPEALVVEESEVAAEEESGAAVAEESEKESGAAVAEKTPEAAAAEDKNSEEASAKSGMAEPGE